MKWRTRYIGGQAFNRESIATMTPIEASHAECRALIAKGRYVHATIHRLVTSLPVQCAAVLVVADLVGIDDAIKFAGSGLAKLFAIG